MFFGIEDGIGVYLLEGSCIRFRVVRKKVRGIKAAKLVDFLLRKRMSLLGDAEEKRLVTLVSDCLLKSQTCVDGFEPVKGPACTGIESTSPVCVARWGKGNHLRDRIADLFSRALPTRASGYPWSW